MEAIARASASTPITKELVTGTGRAVGAFARDAFATPTGAPAEQKGSKLQPTVALSTVEAEAMALCAATVEVEYTRGLLSELSGDKYIPEATPVYVDNKGARDDAYNKTGKRTRHINLRFHRVREAVAKNSIDVKRVTGGNDPATSEMVADILTKSTPAPLFVVMASIMSGMHRK